MKVQILTKDGKTTTEYIGTSLEKLEYSTSLQEKFSQDDESFELAIVSYDSGTINEVKNLDELIEELGKFGL